MQPWFTDVKSGIFVHRGIYAVDGVQESRSPGVLVVPRRIVPHDQYMSQLDRFTGAHYDPHVSEGDYATVSKH